MYTKCEIILAIACVTERHANCFTKRVQATNREPCENVLDHDKNHETGKITIACNN